MIFEASSNPNQSMIVSLTPENSIFTYKPSTQLSPINSPTSSTQFSLSWKNKRGSGARGDPSPVQKGWVKPKPLRGKLSTCCCPVEGMVEATEMGEGLSKRCFQGKSPPYLSPPAIQTHPHYCAQSFSLIRDPSTHNMRD
uniref:Uncharacterized protein n=1 Tax=Taeniopygia guttata TaxID=59729 RepID=A0A674GA33_TAEGU